MSLATLNKQRGLDKQSQSIKTTVTISKVSKTSIGSTSPIPSQSPKSPDGISQKSLASSESPQTVREASKSSDESPFADESIGKKKELAKEKFMTEGTENNRKGEFAKVNQFISIQPAFNLLIGFAFYLNRKFSSYSVTFGRRKHEKS